MASDPKNNWSRTLPKIGSGIAATGILFSGAEPAQAQRPKAPMVARYNNVQDDVQVFIRLIKNKLDENPGESQATDKEIDALVGKFSDDDYEVRQQASKDLAAIGDPAKRALRIALESSDAEVRFRAQTLLAPLRQIDYNKADYIAEPVTRLKHIGSQAEDAIPILIEALKLENTEARIRAAGAIGNIGGARAKEAADQLLFLLRYDKNPLVQEAVIEALGKTGVEAAKLKVALPLLLGALKNEDDLHVKRAAAITLESLGPQVETPDAIAGLIAAIKDKDSTVRQYSACALGNIGVAARLAVPGLAELVKNDEYMGIRYDAVAALGKMGSEASEAIPVLKDLKETLAQVKSDPAKNQWDREDARRRTDIVEDTIARIQGVSKER